MPFPSRTRFPPPSLRGGTTKQSRKKALIIRSGHVLQPADEDAECSGADDIAAGLERPHLYFGKHGFLSFLDELICRMPSLLFRFDRDAAVPGFDRVLLAGNEFRRGEEYIVVVAGRHFAPFPGRTGDADRVSLFSAEVHRDKRLFGSPVGSLCVLGRSRSENTSSDAEDGELCLHRVSRGEQHEGSDVDVCVEMEPRIYLVVRLQRYLEQLLECPVDVIHMHKHINPYLLKDINRDGIYVIN